LGTSKDGGGVRMLLAHVNVVQTHVRWVHQQLHATFTAAPGRSRGRRQVHAYGQAVGLRVSCERVYVSERSAAVWVGMEARAKREQSLCSTRGFACSTSLDT